MDLGILLFPVRDNYDFIVLPSLRDFCLRGNKIRISLFPLLGLICSGLFRVQKCNRIRAEGDEKAAVLGQVAGRFQKTWHKRMFLLNRKAKMDML